MAPIQKDLKCSTHGVIILAEMVWLGEYDSVKHKGLFFTVIVLSGFEGSAGTALNILRIDYGSLGLGGSTGADGGYSLQDEH